MLPEALLGFVTSVLERLGVRYFVTGSVASSYFGEPRFTRDIDIVVALPPTLVKRFCLSFPPPEFYVEPEAVHNAILRHGQFNVVQTSKSLKIDFMVADGSSFSEICLARAREIQTNAGYDAFFSTAEDVILSKLYALREGGTDKHLRDIAGILRVSGTSLDYAYLDDWAERLGVEALWRSVQKTNGST